MIFVVEFFDLGVEGVEWVIDVCGANRASDNLE